jgi:hypothetical protein
VSGAATNATSVTFDILGRRLEASGVDAELAGWLADQWHRPHHAAAPSDYSLGLRCGREPSLPGELRWRLPDEPAAGAGHDVARFETLQRERRGVVLGSVHGGAYLEFAPGAAHVNAWGVAGRLAPGRWPLLLALHDAVRASGLLPLHCAAAVRPGEEGATAFLGPSGVGKSTTLLRLARAGWEPVCEDLAWLDPVSLQLYAWDDDIRLRHDPRQPDGAREPAEATSAAGPKWRLSYEELAERYGVRRRTSARLQRLAWLVRGEGPSRWGRLSRQAAVPPLWEAIGLPLTQPTRRAVAQQVAALVDTVPVCALHLGATPPPPE